MIIKTRQCVAACKNHVARSKVKVTVGALSLCIPKLCPPRNFIPKIGGVKNYLTEMIITTSQCVVCKNYVPRSKVNITVQTYSLCIGIPYSAHNFIRHCETGKLFGPNDHQWKSKNQVATSIVKFTNRNYSPCIGLNEIYLCPAHSFVASGMVQYRDLIFHPFVRSHQGPVLLKALGGGISVQGTHFFSC